MREALNNEAKFLLSSMKISLDFLHTVYIDGDALYGNTGSSLV